MAPYVETVQAASDAAIQAAWAWSQAHPDQASAAAAAAFAALVNYWKTGKLPLGRLPWRALKHTVRDVRYRYFDRPRPKGVPAIVADAGSDEIERLLRDDWHFEGVPYSYYYTGEVFGLRRPAGTARHPDSGREIQMEMHVRGFDVVDGRTLILPHREASRYEAKKAHSASAALSWHDGVSTMSGVLSNAGIGHDHIDSEAEAEIVVLKADEDDKGSTRASFVPLIRRIVRRSSV